MSEWAHLPGAEILEAGLPDLAQGVESVASLLIEIARSRLAAAGVPMPAAAQVATEAAELRLYALLCRSHGDGAYSQYNAWLRRLVSLERALEAR